MQYLFWTVSIVTAAMLAWGGFRLYAWALMIGLGYDWPFLTRYLNRTCWIIGLSLIPLGVVIYLDHIQPCPPTYSEKCSCGH